MTHPETDLTSDEDAAIINFVTESYTRLTPLVLTKYLKQHLNLSGRQASTKLRHLVETGIFCYIYDFGTTFIGLNFSKPVRITDHFILTPPGLTPDPLLNSIHVIITPGISFGSGSHPTTRLCLAAIDTLYFQTNHISDSVQYVADIGTGSGILALAICLLHRNMKCIAYEIDEVSITEALKNIHLNQLSHQIHIRNDSIDTAEQSFSVICANLRLPTLNRLAADIQKKMIVNGVLILSGIRVWETNQLIAVYTEKGFDILWQAEEKDWACLVMIYCPVPLK